MMVINLPGRNTPKHVGNTLGMARTYIGDGVGFDGVYFWNEIKGEIGCYLADDMFSPHMTRKVDATPEIQEKATQWLRERVKSYIPVFVSNHSANRSRDFQRDDKVKVVHGRKIPNGTEGIVFWSGSTKFGMSTGIRFSDRKDSTGKYVDVAFTSPSNLELVNPLTLCLTAAQIEDICNQCATLAVYQYDLYKTVESAVKHHLGIPSRF